MAELHVSCPKCQTRFRVDESHGGKRARCKRCGAAFVIAAADTVGAVVPEAAPDGTPKAPPSADVGAEAVSAAEENVPLVWDKGDVILDLYEVKDIHTGGGMGLVYRVHHRGWDMDLAVKSPRPEYLKAEQQKENFERECETWVNLGLHPNIVSCYYVRRLGSIPRVFAEYVEGGSLEEWIRDGRLYKGVPEEALKGVLDVATQFAWGLQYAHGQGLVHQDVKPLNVMMTPDGTPKVTDFGLARARAVTAEATETAAQTRMLVSSGQYTPAYCSPEQANHEKLSHKTDIWSWAVSVMEMFTGGVTWPSGTVALEALDLLLEEGPEGESIPRMPGGVAELLRYCFRQEPEDRPKDMQEVIVSLKETYEKVAGSRYPREEPSAAELMADGLNNRAVSLLDLNRRNQARSFLAQAVAADASHLAAVHNQAWLEWSEGRASDEELLSAVSRCDLPASERSRKHYLTALVHLNRADLSQAWQELARAADALSASASGAERSPALARQSIVELQIWAGYPAIEGFSPQTDMEAFWDHWRQRAFSCEETLRAPEGQALALRVSPDARRVLLVQETGLVVYDIAGRKMVWQADMPEQLLCAACFDSTGRRVIASTGGGGLLILDARNGVSRLKVSTAGRVYCLLDNVPGTDLLLAGEEQGQLNVMSQEDLSILCSHQAHTGPVRAVACCPTGSLAVSGGADGRLRLWRLPDLAAVQTWAAHDSWVSAVAVDGHCRRILSASYDGELALWEPGNERPVRRYLGHHWAVRALAACWERGLFASGGDRMLRLWHIQSGQCISTEHSGGKVWRCAAVASGQLVMTGLHAPAVFVYRLPASYQVILRPLLSRPKASGTLSEEQRLFSSLVEETRRLFERGHLREAYERARQAQSIPGHADDEELLDILLKGMRLRQRKGLRAVWLRRELTAGDRPVACLALSAQDGRIFFSKADRAYSLGGLRDRTPEPLGGPLGQLINAMALSPSGRWLAAGTICMGRKADVMVLDTESGAAVRTLSGHTETVNALAFSPDGRLLASAGGDHTLRLWSVSPAERPDQWQQVRAFDRGNPLKAVAFSPDGGCLATGGVDRTVDLLDLGSMAIRETMAGHASEITGIAWTTGSPPLFSCAADGTLKSWAPGRRAALHSVTAHEAGVSCLAASGDSRFAASGGKEGTVRLWDLSSLQSLRIMPAHQREVSGLAITEDGGHLITAGYDGRITVWDMDWEFDLNGQITGPASADPAHSG